MLTLQRAFRLKHFVAALFYRFKDNFASSTLFTDLKQVTSYKNYYRILFLKVHVKKILAFVLIVLIDCFYCID